MGPKETRWGLLALAASGLLHCLLVAWMGWVEVPVPAHEVSAEFVFLEPQRPPPEQPPEVEKEPAPTPPPAPVKTAPPVKKAPREAPLGVEAPPEATAAPPPDRPVDDVPRASVTLVPGGTFALSLDAGIVAAEDELPTPGLRALEPPKDLVGLLAKETLGRGRVDRGLVHPYYSQLGKALLKNWDAERVAKSGLKGLVEQTGENFKLYNEIWSDRAAEYGRSGNPLGEVTTTNRRGAVNDRVGGLPAGPDLEQRKELQKQMREAYKATRRAVIRVVQDQGGKLLKVELVQPSNDLKVDKEALADVRSAAEKLPPPPPEALEGRTTLSSIWSFELVISISPPVPTFTFEFDEALGFIDMRLPLDRRIYKKVRLVSVE